MTDRLNPFGDIYAVVMAGGEGVRLRPITYSIPKPLAPIAGEPVLSHMLRLLRRGGIKAAALTLLYKGEQIAGLYGDNFEGLSIRSVFEKKPLGTAGSVKGTADFLRSSDDDVFFVVSGDAVCDIDLRDVLRFHRARGAEATLVLKKVSNPLEYGIVIGDIEGEGGKIEGFIEKPPYSLAYSDLVNTGIYLLSKSVLDSIPDGISYDFARDLFPKMLREKRELYGYVFEGYWCDIGSPEAYRRCCIDAADRKIGGIHSKFSFDRSVVGAGCKIGEGTQLVRSVLQENVVVGKDCIIEEAVLCSGTQVGDGAVLRRGCVIGPGCKIGSGAHIDSGVRIEGNVEIRPGRRVRGTGGASYDSLIYEEEIRIPDTAFALKVGGAVARAVKGGPVGFAHDGSEEAGRMYKSLLKGASREGTDVFALGRTHRQLAAFGGRRFKLETVGYLSLKGGTVTLAFFDKNGQIQPHSFKRTFAKELSVSTQEIDRDGASVNDVSESLIYAYLEGLIEQGGGRKGLVGVRLRVEGGFDRLFERAAEGCGAILSAEAKEDGFELFFDDLGQIARIVQRVRGNSFSVDRAHARGILTAYLVDDNTEVSLSCTEPMIYDTILKSKGCTVVRYSTVPADKGEDAVRERGSSIRWLNDDFFAAMALVRLAVERNSDLRQLSAVVPSFGILEFELDRKISDPTDFVRHFSIISKRQHKSDRREGPVGGDGVLLAYNGGFTRILVPSGNRIRVICDGVSVEAAEELAGFTKSDIENYLKNAKTKE